MLRLHRSLIASLLIACLLSTSGCGCRHHRRRKNELRRAQLRSLQLYRQNQELAGQAEMAGQLAEQNGQLEQSLASAQQNLELTNQRLANLNAERAQLSEKYSTLLTGLKNPLGGGTNRRFEELSKKYPEFEFDPVTGVSRFNGDLLFASGSDVIRTDAAYTDDRTHHRRAHGHWRQQWRVVPENDARQKILPRIVGSTNDAY